MKSILASFTFFLSIPLAWSAGSDDLLISKKGDLTQVTITQALVNPDQETDQLPDLLKFIRAYSQSGSVHLSTLSKDFVVTCETKKDAYTCQFQIHSGFGKKSGHLSLGRKWLNFAAQGKDAAPFQTKEEILMSFESKKGEFFYFYADQASLVATLELL